MTAATPQAVKERGIIMSGPMVLALLEGRKTQTRRVVKPQPTGEDLRICKSAYGWDYTLEGFEPYGADYPAGLTQGDQHYESLSFKCPYGHKGDRLWVREAWATDYPEKLKMPVYEGGQNPFWIIYRASGDGVHEGIGIRWRSPIHMPRWASRITLEIVGVRVERLHDISEEDAKAEGAPILPKEEAHEAFTTPILGRRVLIQECHRYGFQNLWCDIHGVEWGLNPWLWVISFRRIEP